MAPKAVEAHQKGGKSRAEKKPVKAKVEKKPLKEGGKKKKAKKSTETYKIYIYKVLKQVCGFEAFATLCMRVVLASLSVVFASCCWP
jgi:histone H2B